MEMIEARKKRPSISSLFETPRIQRSVAANTKPGQSTHPYDTGAGENTGRPTREITEENIARNSAIPPRPKGSSRQTDRVTAPRETTLRTLERFRDTPTDKPGPSSPQDSTPITTSREGNESKQIPKPRTETVIPSRRRIGFRSMLGPNKRQGETSNTNPSTATSISPNQLSIAVSGHRSWWPFRRHRSTHDRRGGHDFTERDSMLNEEDLTIPHRTRNNRSRSGHAGNRIAKSVYKNGIEDIRTKYEKGIRHKLRICKQSEKIERRTPQQPGRASQETSKPWGLKQQRQNRRSLSSSQVRPSIDRTSAMPVNVPIHRDLRTETPPKTPTQALRLWIGPGRWPSSKAGTQVDLANPGTVTSTSTVLIRRPSRESRISTEHRNKAWIPFWPSPKPQPESARHGLATKYQDREQTTQNRYQ
ncbi:hypothetical protein F4818DRAFT_426493 [Hypoxylon cercidicola]|nr:hypothetical protein F4818DRAFT_426493 [Hypoxylon cercidicola]